MVLITFAYVGLQIGVSLFNQYRNSELTAEIKKAQRSAKLDEIKNNQRRDMKKFQRHCKSQEEMEEAAHVHRIKKIQQDFLETFKKMAHKENLDSHYHLNVSPYVIQRSIIPLSSSDLKNTSSDSELKNTSLDNYLKNIRQELFCILTASNDEAFNKSVLPYLDEEICDLISRFWNESSNHTICYYQNLWDSESNLYSNEDVENIKSLINTPTVSVSPWFQKIGNGHHLILKISAWGVGNEDLLSCEIDTKVSFETLPNKYSIHEIYEIIDQILPYAVCSIGQIADVYYWVTNYLPPHLPYLIGNNHIQISNELKTEYAKVYSLFYKHLVIGIPNEGESLDGTLAEVTETNQYFFPERSLACLKNIITLTATSDLTSEMIQGSMLSFYHAKTDRIVAAVNQLDASLLQSQDVTYVLALIEYANSTGNDSLTKELTEVVKRYVSSWRYTIS